MSAKTWGDYEVHLDQPIGKGGMGAVYRGRQISLDRTVAIKILKRDLTSDSDFVGRFNREATLLAKLVDTHVVQIFGAGEAEGQHFYAMEYVDGEDLASRLRRGHQFAPDEILHIAVGTGKALDAAWKQKIIHRDIKPSNIIVTREDQVVKVMDFGLAKNPESDLTRTEMIMGTAKYMSPEQATGGECDIRSDLYALGAVMYELGTGTAPFVGESATAVIYQHVHKEPIPPQKLNPSLPQSLQSVILRLLSKSPEDRYPSPGDLVKDCQAILEGVTPDEKTILYGEIGKEPPSTVETMEKKSSPLKSSGGSAGKIVAVVLLLIVLAGGGAWFGMDLFGPGPEKDLFSLALADAEKAATGGAWERALQKYTEALRHLPEGDGRWGKVERARDTAGYQNTMSVAEKAKGAGDLESALEKYAEAQNWLPEGDDRIEKLERLVVDSRIELVEKYTIQRKWSRVIQECDELQASLAAEDDRRSKVSSLRDRARGERSLAKADDSFEEQKWPVAIQEYETVKKLLPADHPRWRSLSGRIAVAEYEMHIGAASRETDLDQRIILLEQASRVTGLEEGRRKNSEKLLRRARVTRALERAGKQEGAKDWPGVGEALEEAARYEDDAAKAAEYIDKGEFFAEFGRLVHMVANRKWKEAATKISDLLARPTHFGKTTELTRNREEIQASLALLVEEELRKNRAEFIRRVGDSIRAYERGEWARAAKLIDGVAAEKYEPFHAGVDGKFGTSFSILVERMKKAGSPPEGMVYVPTRKYRVGKDGAGVSGPAHDVRLKEFYIDRNEVDVAAYAKFLDGAGAGWECVEACPCGNDARKHIPYKWEDQQEAPGEPVRGVNWWDASAYMRWRSSSTGERVRLPTEEEMEVAASYDLAKNQKRLYPWGDQFGSGMGESFLRLAGLHNQVLEWTSSRWVRYPGYEGSFPREGKDDFVLRGGYKISPETELQTFFRRGDRPLQRGRNYGFRSARSIE